jgi:hypothetical protein
VFKRKSLPWLLLPIVILTGCGTNSDENAVSVDETELSAAEVAWYAACEADYKSSDCKKKIELMILDFYDEQNLYADIHPYEDYEKSSDCLTDPKGTSCTALRLLADSQITDLKCEGVEAFGFGYFCWGQILVRNTGSIPIDDYLEVSLYDIDGNQFAADVEGDFDFGVVPLSFSRNVSVQLNPEKAEFFQFGFSVPDIERQFTHIGLSGNENTFHIPLCRKNSGDLMKIAKDYEETIVIYEKSRLLNSCKYDRSSGVYTNRLDGSLS